MIRVLLVDDQPLVRAGIKMILGPEDGFAITGECEDGAAAIRFYESLRPDVILMDVRMRGMDGVEATRRLTAADSSARVLILTTFDDDEVLSGALRSGASGFVLKDAPAEELIAAVRAVAEGEAWLDPAVTGRVLAAYRTGPSAASAIKAPDTDELTPREVEVLRLIGRGASNAEIGEQLVIGETTVKTHIGHILDKLGLRDRAAAIVYAFDHGLVRPK